MLPPSSPATANAPQAHLPSSSASSSASSSSSTTAPTAQTTNANTVSAITIPRADIARTLLLQAPPGELRDVLNDVRAIYKDDNAIVPLLAEALPKYNAENFIEVTVAGTQDKLLICPRALLLPQQAHGSAAAASSARLLDPRTNTSYAIDHAALTASDPVPRANAAEHMDARCNELQRGITSYVTDHLSSGVGLVFPYTNDADSDSGICFEINIVNTKINNDNFWNARWRSQWVWSPAKSELVGTVHAFVHFFEEGNVQLNTKRDYALNVPAAAGDNSAASVAAVLRMLRDSEEAFRVSLEKSFVNLSDNVYKRLRRGLPVTKTKMNWLKASAYAIGNELNRK